MAKYNLSSQFDADKFKRYSDTLIKGGKFVELRNITKRSLSQNNYLHLLLGWFGASFGYSLAYVKLRFFKKVCNKDLFFVERTNPKDETTYTDIRSSADLSTAEMTTAIDRFRNYSSDNGLYLPQPNELVYLQEIEKELETLKEHL